MTVTKRKTKKEKTKLVHFSEREKEALTNQKIKNFIEFDEQYSASIKSLSIQKNTKIDLTTRFLNGKMLMFSKVSIKSFVYDIIDVFMFPNEEIKKKMSKIQDKQVPCRTELNNNRQYFNFFCIYLRFGMRCARR